MTLRVIQPGWATTVQDRGRPGHAALGVPSSGAVDRAALDLANRLVGNRPDAAALETAGGLIVEALGPLIVATSADGIRHTLQPGGRLAVGAPPDGMWGYLAVRGGIDVTAVLGSRSRDTLSGLGPAPPVAGAALAVGSQPASDLPADHAPPRPRELVARLWPGPHRSSFGGTDLLTVRAWTVQRDVSRVGVRLSAGPFVRGDVVAQAALPSFGLVEGAIQITPSDEPIVMLADHPTTGGYPVIAVVEPDDIGVVAQARPGSELRFRRA